MTPTPGSDVPEREAGENTSYSVCSVWRTVVTASVTTN